MNDKIWFEKNLLRSKAFRSLSKWAFLVYLDFLRKRQMEPVKRARRSDEWVIKNNGEIVYPYVEAEKKGIGRREFRNAIDELMEKGFLDIAHQGSGGRSGDMTKYILDDRWKEQGTPAFRPPRNPRRKDTRGGRGWSAFHAKQQKSPVTKSLPKNAVSSSRSDTPNEKSQSLSSDRSDTPKVRKNEITDYKERENKAPSQLSLWSNENVTIL